MPSQLIQNSSPEGQLLLYCSRNFFYLDKDNSHEIKTLLQQNIDWDYTLQMGEKHRIIPLIYNCIKLKGADLISQEIWQDLRKRFHKNTCHNLLITKETLSLLTKFQLANISIIPYKGTVFAAKFYGKTALRQVWDIDFWVTEDNFSQACDLLTAEGYHVKEVFDREQSFFNSEKNIEVDLHLGFTPFYFPVNIDFALLETRTQKIEVLNSKVDTFCDEDLLLILCIQIAKDCWERRLHIEHLLKVCDIAQLLRNSPNLQWHKVLERSRKQGSLRILYFGLFLANNLLDAPLPKEIEIMVKKDSTAVSLAHQVCSNLFSDIDRSFASEENSLLDLKFRWRQLLFYLKMRERPQDWWQYFWETNKTIMKLLINYINKRNY